MNNLDSVNVKFQAFEFQSDSNAKFENPKMDSASVNIQIPEISLDHSAQNNMKNMRNYHENLRAGGIKSNGIKLACCCFTFVFVMVLLGGLIYLGFRTQENGKIVEDSNSTRVFGHLNSSNFGNFGNFGNWRNLQPRAESLEEQSPNSNPKTFETAQLLQTLLANFVALVSDKAKAVTDQISQLEDDLKAQDQIAALEHNRSLEVKFNELKKEISLLKDQMMVQWLNFSSQSATPPLLTITKTTTTTSAPPTLPLSTPRFYANPEHKGRWFSPAMYWENSCVNMPTDMSHNSQSVDLGGHCLLVCPGKDCQKLTNFYEIHYGKECIELRPKTYGLDNLKNIEYNHVIRSFRRCQTK